MIRLAFHTLAIILLTVMTMIGGIAWLVASRARLKALVFVVVYLALSLFAFAFAPMFGRVPIACSGDGAVRMQSPIYCALNRHYVARRFD